MHESWIVWAMCGLVVGYFALRYVSAQLKDSKETLELKANTPRAKVMKKRLPRSAFSTSKKHRLQLRLLYPARGMWSSPVAIVWWQEVKKDVYDNAVPGEFIDNPLYETPSVIREPILYPATE